MDRYGRTKPLQAIAATLAVMAMSLFAVPPSLTWAGGYGFDPGKPRDERPGNVYFGSAKDASGDFVSGVTVVLETQTVDYVAVTDATGRFRLEVADELAPADVKPRCSRRDNAPGRIVRRLPPGGAKTPVQVDCMLDR